MYTFCMAKDLQSKCEKGHCLEDAYIVCMLYVKVTFVLRHLLADEEFNYKYI